MLTSLACTFLVVFLSLNYKLGPETPTGLVVILYSSVAYGGYYFHTPSRELLAAVGDITPELAANTFSWLNGFILSLVVGTCIAKSVLKHELNLVARIVKDRPFTLEVSTNHVIISALLALALLLVGSGPNELFVRYEYMVENNKILKSLGGLGSLLGCYLLGMTKATSHRQKVAVALVVGLTALVFLGYASRSFAICFVLFFVGRYFTQPTKRNAFSLILVSFASPFLLSIPLLMRGAQTQGLLPLASDLSGYVYRAADLGYLELLDNFIFSSFDIAAATSQANDIDTGYILTALNPLPGVFTDFYSYNPGLTDFIPYNVVGEWICYSPVAGMLFFLSIGIVFGVVERYALVSPGLVNLARLSLILFIFLSLQYTTRAALRPIFYLISVAVSAYGTKRLRDLLQSASSPRQ